MISCHSISYFNENLVDEFRGVMIEALGYDDYDQYGQHYGEKKDNSALALLDAHFAQIYVAREQARDGDPESLYTWYQENAKYIGKNAPLLTETQYGLLMEMLVKYPGRTFKDTIWNLAENWNDYKELGFEDITSAKEFQKIFGVFKNAGIAGRTPCAL